MNRLFVALLGLALFPAAAKSETVTAFGTSSSDRLNDLNVVRPPELMMKGMPDVSRVSDWDSTTREHSNIQYLTTTGSVGALNAMTRNGEGVLYGITQGQFEFQSNGLITIDETTGEATLIGLLADGSAGYDYSVRCPAIAFVPGQEETLYAIIKRQQNYQEMESPAPPDIDTGFILVTIDPTTGVTTDTGIYLGGQNNGQGHGLTYDVSLGRLLYFYYGSAPGNEPASGVTVEVIDPVNMTVDIAFYQPAPPPPGTVFETPYSFTGVAGYGNGRVVTYDSRNSYEFYMFMVSETSGGYAYDYMQLSDGFNGNTIKAMDLGQNENLLVSTYSGLYEYDEGFNQVGTPLEVRMGGFPFYSDSLVTQPGSGALVALTRDGGGKGRPRNLNGSGVGLAVIDRDGPEMLELDGLDLEFQSDQKEPASAQGKENGGGVNVYAIEALAFDENGNLYGYDDDYEQIVEINLQTGEVTPYIQINKDMEKINGFYFSGRMQLSYNPEDGNFYLLTWVSGEGPSYLGFFSLTRGGTLTEIPLNGDEDLEYLANSPLSLVFTGLGSFYFTMESMYRGGNSIFGQVDTGGNVTLFTEMLQMSRELEMRTFETTGLALAGLPPQTDISVGASRNRLKGNNIYNRSGARQRDTVRNSGKRLKVDFFARVENDGDYPALMEVRGPRGKGPNKIIYKADGRNVTGQVIRGAGLELGAGQGTNLKVTLSRRGGGRWVTNNRIESSYGRNKDVGKVRSLLIAPRNRPGRKPANLF